MDRNTRNAPQGDCVGILHYYTNILEESTMSRLEMRMSESPQKLSPPESDSVRKLRPQPKRPTPPHWKATSHSADVVPCEQPGEFLIRGGWVYSILKRTLDIAISLPVLAFATPVMMVIAALVRLDSPGPAFFSQARCGKDGKLFNVYKLRTMFTDAATYGESPRDDRKDVRVTRIGYFLRRTSLDELPQFWCVLKGDMSIVGPRPEMEFIVRDYTPRMRQRLRVTPGITGPWQVSEHRKEPIHDHLEYDFYYLQNRSLWLDLKVIGQTASLVFLALKNSVLNRAHLQKI